MGYRRSLLSSFSLCLWLSCNALELNRHGFEGLLVAIHKNVPESELLLSNLQEFLARASRQLAELTSRTYFRHVTILVPETWRSRRGLIPIDVDLFEHADVRVVPQTLASSMSTLQPASCGKPGRYITVPDFVIMHKDSAPIYMSPEYQFLHEWAKFRYGVFDELGLPDSSRFPFAYTDGNTVYPVAQSKNVFGILARKDGTACAATPTGILHNDCRLYIDTRNTTMLETLMKMPYVAPRNPVAARYLPTKQNVLCNRKSTRELIFGHKDFSKKGSVPTQVPDTMFTMFRARSHYAKKVVLLIDTSESMARNNWVKLVHQGVARFIQGRLPPGFFFGMLSFSDEVTVAANITRITKDTRRTLRTLIPFVSTGTEANAFKAIIAAAQVRCTQPLLKNIYAYNCVRAANN
ncbi:calcium-activated chloride channel regulator family member 3-like [Ornithodoros turicata]|uniref:calcium-activated chloride channel regulator family member 3-like n=1 Tax=Ornithodoros turicata TaxID=34597 RepID=UPI003139E418